MRIDEAIREATLQLKTVTSRPRLEAEILLSHHLNCDRVTLHLKSKESLKNLDIFFNLIRRRTQFEPIEYITKRVSFYSEEFFIDRGALIPRPETELLVDIASDLIDRFNIKRVVEVGVGSGIISIILAKKHPQISIIATDISEDALKIAKKNIKLFNLQDRVLPVCTSLTDGINDKIELMVSNPPYISKDFKLEPNILNFEPHTALFAEDNGVKILKKIVEIALENRVKALACEMGFNQKELMKGFFDSLGIRDYGFYKDLASLDRGFWLIN